MKFTMKIFVSSAEVRMTQNTKVERHSLERTHQIMKLMLQKLLLLNKRRGKNTE